MFEQKDIIKGLHEESLRLQNKINNLSTQRLETLKAIEWINQNGIDDLSVEDLLTKVQKM